MSSLIVEVCRVERIEPHPGADRMAIACLKGWRVCVNTQDGKPWCGPGDLAVYLPPDSVIPPELSDRLGITRYLTPLPTDPATGIRPPGGRVRVARLRGFPSYGALAPLDILPARERPWQSGDDVAALLGISKYEPPLDCLDGDAEKPHPRFARYFTLENWRNFPEVFQAGEEVIITEKLHGMNCRLGLIREADEQGAVRPVFMAGSHDVRRKEFLTRRKKKLNPETGLEEIITWEEKSKFWQVLTQEVRVLMLALAGLDPMQGSPDLSGLADVVLYGELFGSGIQDMAYGLDGGRFAFRVFDATVDGRYLDWDRLEKACAEHGVPTVPLLYRGPYAVEIVESLVSGPTTLCPAEKAGKFKGREGIVIKTARERPALAPAKHFERAALKAVSFEYLERKGGSEHH